MPVADRQAVALRAVQLMKDMDLRGTGIVDLEEWLHHGLLCRAEVPALQAMQLINCVIKEFLNKRPHILADLQRTFEVADRGGRGVVSLADIREMYEKGLWRWDPKAGRPVPPSEASVAGAEESSGHGRDLPKELLETMKLDSQPDVTYAEFMAYCCGRRKEEVSVNFYDLSNGMASMISPWLLGQRLEGLWHTGVVAYGKEYYYGGEIFFDEPGETPFGKPTKSMVVGYTVRSQMEFHAHIVSKMKPLFTRDVYDVVNRNCNHFSDAACSWLTGLHISSEVVRQPEGIMKVPLVKLLRPVLNRWLGNADSAREPPEKAKRRSGPGAAAVAAAAAAAEGLVARLGTAVQISAGLVDFVPLVGAVCGPTAPSPGAPDASSSGVVWVRVLDTSTPPRLRTECLPLARLLPMDVSEQLYLTALRSVNAACPKLHSLHGEGASSGLRPSLMGRPGSVLSDGMDDEVPFLESWAPWPDKDGSAPPSESSTAAPIPPPTPESNTPPSPPSPQSRVCTPQSARRWSLPLPAPLLWRPLLRSRSSGCVVPAEAPRPRLSSQDSSGCLDAVLQERMHLEDVGELPCGALLEDDAASKPSPVASQAFCDGRLCGLRAAEDLVPGEASLCLRQPKALRPRGSCGVSGAAVARPGLSRPRPLCRVAAVQAGCGGFAPRLGQVVTL